MWCYKVHVQNPPSPGSLQAYYRAIFMWWQASIRLFAAE